MPRKARKKARRKAEKQIIRTAVIGYGGAFNMGKSHAEWMNAVDGFETIAACDTDPKRLVAAQEELPGLRTYRRVGSLLRNPDVDLCVIITPHDSHAKLAIQCLNARKHVVVEKPMCITAKQATDMIRAARKNDVCLTVFHNRRHDGDYLAIKQAIDQGRIGQVFHVEMWGGGYGRPGTWWRSDKKVSGGHFYDWGAHYFDWLLNLMAPRKMVGVTGAFHKLVWKHVSNEDHVEALVRFDDGAVADVQFSSIAAVGKPR
ncbi:MAG: Gfo/Idh/MocA family protein [Armatimonadota bacterium]